MNHPAGTCRAGNDEYSVVDPQLKVHGVDGLRIIDSSIMPSLPRANTHAPSIMIGERGVEFIKQGTLKRDEKQGLAIDVPTTAATF
jgi:choline dehydrogenase